tara:strand:- start:175 stop:765 length:591 start_codon:yes stop_codon:yes gene_type:complete
MTLSATATATADTGNVSPKISPNSITTVSYYNRPNSVSAWTTSAPQILYQAPSTCKYARIVIPDTAKQSNTTYNNESFKLDSSGSHNRWLGIGIVNDTNSTEDMILKNYSGSTSYNIFLNSFANDAISNQYNYISPYNRGPFDVVAIYKTNSNYYNYVNISGDRFILNPGEKFVALTGNDNTSEYIFANFQAWVYN